MKKIFVTIILFLLVSMPMFTEGLYFDGGIGIGNATTTLDGDDISDYFSGSDITEIGVDLSLKLGYGPISGVPFYIAGALGGIGHRFEDSYNYIQFNSYLIGPSVILYPVSPLQLSGSAGFSWVANDTDVSGDPFYDSESGYAFDISAALDLGQGNHGFLLGAKYCHATNTLEISKAEQVSSMLSIFIKYAYRHKPNSGSDW